MKMRKKKGMGLNWRRKKRRKRRKRRTHQLQIEAAYLPPPMR